MASLLSQRRSQVQPNSKWDPRVVQVLEPYGAIRIANRYGVWTISHLDLTILVLGWRAFKNVGRCWEAGGDPTAMIAPQIAAYGKL